jgi:hypothetical protein
VFFLVIEPFSNTSCYSKSCINEIQFYVYSRYIFILFEVLVRTVMLFLNKSKTTIETELLSESKGSLLSFESRVADMLEESMKESERPEHKDSNNLDLIALIGFGLYNLLLPLLVSISLLNLVLDTFYVRTVLLEFERRPINRSQSMLTRTTHIRIVYYISITITAWI